MDRKVSEQYYFRMYRNFYDYRSIGIRGTLLCFGDMYLVISENGYRIHRKADNDNVTFRDGY